MSPVLAARAVFHPLRDVWCEGEIRSSYQPCQDSFHSSKTKGWSTLQASVLGAATKLWCFTVVLFGGVVLNMTCCGVMLQAQMADVSRACSSKEAECRQLQECSEQQQRQLAEAAAAATQQSAELASVQADLCSAQQQLAEVQQQCEGVTAERALLQQQHAEGAAAAAKLREQLQQAHAEVVHAQKEVESSAREASSLRLQLSGQVAALQQLQQAASGSGKELQVRWKRVWLFLVSPKLTCKPICCVGQLERVLRRSEGVC